MDAGGSCRGDHTVLGNTLSDTDDEGNLGLDGLLNTGSSHRGTMRGVSAVRPGLTFVSRLTGGLRDEDGGGSGAGLLHGVGNIGEDGEAEVLLAGLLGVRAANNLGAYDRAAMSEKGFFRRPRAVRLGFTIFDGLLGVEAENPRGLPVSMI